MASQSIQSKSLLGVALALACIGLGYFLYSYIWPDYSLAKQQLKDAQRENLRLTNALDSMEKFIDDYKNFKTQSQSAANIDLALPTSNSDVANFINTLSDIATQSGVVLAGFQISESPQKAPENAIQPVDISFISSGSYLSLKDFILKLQNSLRLMDITNVTVNSMQNNTGTAILQYSIKLKTYYQQ